MAAIPLSEPAFRIVLAVSDVLLMRSKGEITKLIMWCSDSVYSHAAIVVDGGDLIEAAKHGARRFPIAARLADTAEYEYVDAFRPLTAERAALDEEDREAVLRKAQSLVKTPYPLNSLATLGVLVAIRGKVPQSRRARVFLRALLDFVVRNDPSHQMCSELVYRSLAECAVRPPGKLAPEIVVTEKTDQRFPHINWLKLFWEILDAKGAARLAGYVLGRAVGFGVTQAEFDRAVQHARVKLGIPPPDHGIVPQPNPKMITPLDLTATPCHTALGRLMGPPTTR